MNSLRIELTGNKNLQGSKEHIQLYNNIAWYNLIDTKYHQMAFQSPSDGHPISPYLQSFGTPGQTKVSGDR